MANKLVLTLSFSGAGHLLPYHLGVASSIARRQKQQQQQGQKGPNLPPIAAVAGSSSGAMAAAVFVRAPHRLKEFAYNFIEDGGRAFHHLEAMLRADGLRHDIDDDNDNRADHRRVDGGGRRPSLHVAATRCSDGSLRLFNFYDNHHRRLYGDRDIDELLTAVEASCRIPSSFHPADVLRGDLFSFFPLSSSSSRPTYPDAEGVLCVDGHRYVDGAISAPAPPTLLDNTDGSIRVVVSPFSLVVGGIDENVFDNVIGPAIADEGRSLLPFDLRLHGGFTVRSSIQNSRALATAMLGGRREELVDWFRRGQDDGGAWIARSFG